MKQWVTWTDMQALVHHQRKCIANDDDYVKKKKKTQHFVAEIFFY